MRSSSGNTYESDESTEDDADPLTLEEREKRSGVLRRYRTLRKGSWTKRDSYHTQTYQRNEFDTYEVIPLQYLYNGTEMEYMRFPPEIEKPSGLRIM